jgi:hypothetical protein
MAVKKVLLHRPPGREKREKRRKEKNVMKM